MLHHALRALSRLSFTAAVLMGAPAQASAQGGHEGHDMSPDSVQAGPVIRAGASGIVLASVAAPGVNKRTLAEGYLTQPMVMAMLMTPGGRFIADLTLNFEGSTLERGELNAGVYGEGYVDRRHPHTLLHELVGTAFFPAGRARLSLTAGKGFVPFGTDDPMSRPFVKYPVNHHLAQLLERAMVSGAAAYGPLVLEAAAFNGDEPESPYDLPNYDRIGDSWSARLSARTTAGLEVQGSFASVESPEHAIGGGLDHRKLSVSGRFESRGRYLLAEWARTSEREGDESDFEFSSVLAEGSIELGKVKVAARAERSERPEEERDLNPFRTPRPHSDVSIIGQTRWDIASLSVSAQLPSYRKMRFAPFVEVSTQKPSSLTTPAVFEPAAFYGEARLWSFSLGARLGVGMRHGRMGRYGVAANLDAHKGH